MKNWKEHFMSLLGEEERIVIGERNKGREREEETKINRKERKEIAIKKLKDGKAIGRNEIPKET